MHNNTSCKFCTFGVDNPDHWEICLYRCTSYKYEGVKYQIEVEYPLGDLTQYPNIKPIEVYFCPICGRKLNDNIVKR